MKRFLAILGLSAILLAPIFAQSVSPTITFSWTPNPPQELVSGYRLEYQKLPAVTNWSFLNFIPSTTNTTSVSGLQGGYVYMFRLFAVNGIGIGTNLSNVIQIPTNAPSGVTNFQQGTSAPLQLHR